MPPKANKGKKGGKGKGKDKKEENAEEEQPGTPPPTDKEVLLQKEWVLLVLRNYCYYKLYSGRRASRLKPN